MFQIHKLKKNSYLNNRIYYKTMIIPTLIQIKLYLNCNRLILIIIKVNILIKRIKRLKAKRESQMNFNKAIQMKMIWCLSIFQIKVNLKTIKVQTNKAQIKVKRKIESQIKSDQNLKIRKLFKN